MTAADREAEHRRPQDRGGPGRPGPGEPERPDPVVVRATHPVGVVVGVVHAHLQGERDDEGEDGAQRSDDVHPERPHPCPPGSGRWRRAGCAVAPRRPTALGSPRAERYSTVPRQPVPGGSTVGGPGGIVEQGRQCRPVRLARAQGGEAVDAPGRPRGAAGGLEPGGHVARGRRGGRVRPSAGGATRPATSRWPHSRRAARAPPPGPPRAARSAPPRPQGSRSSRRPWSPRRSSRPSTTTAAGATPARAGPVPGVVGDEPASGVLVDHEVADRSGRRSGGPGPAPFPQVTPGEHRPGQPDPPVAGSRRSSTPSSGTPSYTQPPQVSLMP